jgi:hypothetical protein
MQVRQLECGTLQRYPKQALDLRPLGSQEFFACECPRDGVKCSNPLPAASWRVDRMSALLSLFGNLIFQIAEGLFGGLNDLLHLLGVFIAYKYADGKNHNK